MPRGVGDRPGSASPAPRLIAVKLVHTIVWALFVACIVGIPIAAHRGRYATAGWLTAIVLAEVAVLAVNHWRCPLTAIAARFTEERQPNFDIYLPEWLARHNQVIFGSLYLAGVVYAVARWMMDG